MREEHTYVISRFHLRMAKMKIHDIMIHVCDVGKGKGGNSDVCKV